MQHTFGTDSDPQSIFESFPLEAAIPFDQSVWEGISKLPLREGYHLKDHPDYHRIEPRSSLGVTSVSIGILKGIERLRADWKGLGDHEKTNVSPIMAGGHVLSRIHPDYPGCFAAGDIDIFLVGPRDLKSERLHLTQALMEHGGSFGFSRSGFAITNHRCSQSSEHIKTPNKLQVVFADCSSIDDVLTSFDIDPCCFAFDGETLWGLPRAIAALYNRVNYYHPELGTYAYGHRVAKYIERGYEFIIPLEYGANSDTISMKGLDRKEPNLAKVLRSVSNGSTEYAGTMYDDLPTMGDLGDQIRFTLSLISKGETQKFPMIFGIFNELQSVLDGKCGKNVPYVEPDAPKRKTLESLALLQHKNKLSPKAMAAIEALTAELDPPSEAFEILKNRDLGPIKFDLTVEGMKRQGQTYLSETQKTDWLCIKCSLDEDANENANADECTAPDDQPSARDSIIRAMGDQVFSTREDRIEWYKRVDKVLGRASQ